MRGSERLAEGCGRGHGRRQRGSPEEEVAAAPSPAARRRRWFGLGLWGGFEGAQLVGLFYWA